MLLQEEGVKFLLSEKFSQDPLEEHFARHKRMGGCNDNPTQAQVAQQEIALSVITSNLISDLRRNAEGRQRNREPLKVDDIRLPKKRPLNKP